MKCDLDRDNWFIMLSGSRWSTALTAHWSPGSTCQGQTARTLASTPVSCRAWRPSLPPTSTSASPQVTSTTCTTASVMLLTLKERRLQQYSQTRQSGPQTSLWLLCFSWPDFSSAGRPHYMRKCFHWTKS